MSGTFTILNPMNVAECIVAIRSISELPVVVFVFFFFSCKHLINKLSHELISLLLLLFVFVDFFLHALIYVGLSKYFRHTLSMV